MILLWNWLLWMLPPPLLDSLAAALLWLGRLMLKGLMPGLLA